MSINVENVLRNVASQAYNDRPDPEKWISSQQELGELRLVCTSFKNAIDAMMPERWKAYKEMADQNIELSRQIETKKEKLQELTSWKSTISGLCGNVASAVKSYFSAPTPPKEDEVAKLKEKIAQLEKTKAENEMVLLGKKLDGMASFEKIQNLFGGPVGWDQLPILDMTNLDTGNDYIDFLTADVLTAPIMKGKDTAERNFVVLRFRIGRKWYCQVIHQRVTSNMNNWVTAERERAVVRADGSFIGEAWSRSAGVDLRTYRNFEKAIKEKVE